IVRPNTMLILVLCHLQVRPLCSNTPENRGIPLVGSCATSTCTRPSDTDGRSPARETCEKGGTEPWALSSQPRCLPNEMSRPLHTIGMWELLGGHSLIRSACSTATVTWGVHAWEPMIGAAWLSSPPGYGLCRR